MGRIPIWKLFLLERGESEEHRFRIGGGRALVLLRRRLGIREGWESSDGVVVRLLGSRESLMGGASSWLSFDIDTDSSSFMVGLEERLEVLMIRANIEVYATSSKQR